tara:strand:+ start:7773 stop:8987 length:1215 start_codon:yes stop_codon:yes gene_type:complete
MSNKDILSITDFTTPEEKSELFGQSVRNSAIPGDVFGGKTLFKAIVLKISAKDLSADQVSAMIGTSDQKLPRSDVNTKFHAYRVRIIDDNSPHSFLPIPCGIADSAKPSNHLLINMHTMVFKSTQSGKNLNPGDIVQIRLTPKDFSYDLNYGMIVGDKLSHNAAKLSSEKGVPCISATSAFEFNNNITTLGSIMGTDASGLPEGIISDPGIAGVKVIGPQLLTLAMVGYIVDLKQYMDSKDIRIPLNITSGYRTAEKQAQIMYNYGTDAQLRKLYKNSIQIEKFITEKRKGLAAATDCVKQYASIGVNFSKHQQQLGFDLRTKDLSDEQVSQLMNVLRQTGAKPLFEPLGCSKGGIGGSPSKRGCKNEHIHVGVAARYAMLTKEQVDNKVAALGGDIYGTSEQA